MPDKTPTATTSDNITIDDTTWVMGTYPEFGDGYDKLFEGTFEKEKYYYAMISISAKDGYKLSSDLTIKVNGETPAEVFAVYNNENTFFIAKIKATENTTTDDPISSTTDNDNATTIVKATTTPTSSTNPQTGDQLPLYLSLLLSSLSLLVFSTIYSRRRIV